VTSPGITLDGFIGTMGGGEYESARTAQMTSDGGYIILGTRGGMRESDIYLVKVNSEGEKLWSKTFSGSEHDRAKHVRETTDGGFIILGLTGYFSYDAYIIKTDSAGNEQWSKTFINNISVKYILETTDNCYTVLGRDRNNFPYGLSLLKFDESGNEIWLKPIGNDDHEWFSSIQQTSDDGFILGGTLNQNYSDDMYLVKTDNKGNKLWSKYFNFSDGDRGQSVKETSDGGFILAGSTYNSNLGRSVMYVVKTDNYGNELWYKTYEANEDLEAVDVHETSDSGFILAGNNPFESHNIYLIKTDSNGDEQWITTYEPNIGAHASFVKETNDGSYIVAGSESRLNYVGLYESDMLLLKADDKGHWTMYFIDR
jgi:hypothetical protein